MPTLFLKHKVKSYDSWRPAYDRHLVARAQAGLREVGVFRDAKDSNDLLIVWTTDNLGQAKSFLNSLELKSKMKESGVVSEPEVWFADPESRAIVQVRRGEEHRAVHAGELVTPQLPGLVLRVADVFDPPS